MSKKITTLCSIIIALSVCVAAFGVDNAVKTDVTTATAKFFYAENEETTNSTGSLGGIVDDVVGGIGGGSSGLGDALGGLGDGSLGDSLGNIGSGSSGGGLGEVLGGVGDAIGGIGDGFGDVLGGILGGGSAQKPTSAPVQTTEADIGLIIPVPAATQSTTQVTESNTTEEQFEGETVDYAATSNPYKKPTGTYAAGDKDEGIKWLQWIFIYTDYGLKADGITGVLDEATVAVVKKLQHDNDLEVNGNVTENVIKAAEVLYYQSVLGDNMSAVEVPSELTTGVSVSYEAVVNEQNSGVSVVLLIVILVLVWLFAIIGIVLLFIFKKKKIASMNTATKAVEEETETAKNQVTSSIADLFEEAEKNGK